MLHDIHSFSQDMPQSESFPVTHLKTKRVFHRNPIFLNPHHRPDPVFSPVSIDPAIELFHKELPHYAPTPLTSLPDLAKELGFSQVYIKDESLRFGLPSFKVLGASWAVYRALCSTTALPRTVSLEEAGSAARERHITLVTCSAGNWGRAVSRIAKYAGVKVTVFLGTGASKATKDTIRAEDAHVVEIDGTYDDSIAAAIEEGKKENCLLVMDTSWDGFEDIPQVGLGLDVPT